MGSQDQPKKPYSTPTLTKLTPEQAKRLVMDRKHCSEEEAEEVLNSQQAQRTSKAQERKRSA